MPSTRRQRKLPDQPPPEFFLDRSLGRHDIYEALTARGYTAHTLWQVYGRRREQKLDDQIWIEESAAKGWVCLTWDYLRLQRLRQAILRAEAKVFRIGREAATSEMRIEWLDRTLPSIIRRARKPGGWIDVVRKDTVERYWPKS